jgi:ribonucleoside-diphosphate reductase alpha chain
MVAQVYMRAWESGCKGFTVYRDGSRSGVLISAEENKIKEGERPNTIIHIMSPKRPQILPCDIKKAKINGENWTIFVGLFNNQPYEVFGGLSKYIDIPNKYKVGKIIKNGIVDGVSTYNLVIGEGEDEMILKDIASIFENTTHSSFTRSISLSLRHGVLPQYVVEQLQKDKHSDITSFSKVMARVLKSYITEGAASSGEKVCEGCKQKGTLKYQEGCLSCTSCSWSKC